MDYATTPPAPRPTPKVYVYDRNWDPRYQDLCTLYRWWSGTQHDYCYADWMGRSRAPGCSYLADRHRDKGFVWQHEIPKVSYDARRPNAPSGLAARVISRFTELTLGSPVTLLCPSDDDTTAFLAAVYEESCSHDALQEARDYAGATGSAVVIPSLTEGRPNCEALPSFAVEVLEWADRKRWIPRVVVHQYRVEVMADDKPERVPEVKVRTRMWTDTEYIEFKDVSLDFDRNTPLVEAERVDHRAGRCPVVWVQNTKSTRSPEGQLDLLNVANLELCDEVDRILSHSLKATKANTQPTLVREDDLVSFAQQFPRLATGVGAEIRVSKGGSVTLLETKGDSVAMGWNSAAKLEERVLKNVNCWMPESETITSAPSGVAVAKLRRGMETRCNRFRTSLTWVIRQVSAIWISIGLGFKVSSEDDPGENTLVLPPRCYKIEPPEPEETEEPADPLAPPPRKEPPEEKLGPHKVGNGRSVKVAWPPYDHLTPADLKDLALALTTVTGDEILSRRSATEMFVSAAGLRDAEDEQRRLAEEKAERAANAPVFGAGDPVGAARKAAEDGAAAQPSGAEDQEPEMSGSADG